MQSGRECLDTRGTFRGLRREGDRLNRWTHLNRDVVEREDRHIGAYAPDGRLFITFRDTTLESPTKGDWVGWVGTYDDIVAGREGLCRVRLMDNHKGADCAYPGLERLPSGEFVTTTYGHWTPDEPPYIVSIRFSLPEIDERLKATSAK